MTESKDVEKWFSKECLQGHQSLLTLLEMLSWLTKHIYQHLGPLILKGVSHRHKRQQLLDG